MKISGLAKKMIVAIAVIALACILGSMIYYRSLEFLPFLFGTVIGSAVSIAKVFLLENAVNKALTMEKNQAGGYVGLQYILRLILTGIVLFLGAVIPQISIWGVAAGILAFQLSLFVVRFTSKD